MCVCGKRCHGDESEERRDQRDGDGGDGKKRPSPSFWNWNIWKTIKQYYLTINLIRMGQYVGPIVAVDALDDEQSLQVD